MNAIAFADQSMTSEATNQTTPTTMRAAVISRFGGPEVVDVMDVDVPTPKLDEVLIRVNTSTVSQADRRRERVTCRWESACWPGPLLGGSGPGGGSSGWISRALSRRSEQR